MLIRIESETGEFLTELDLQEMEVNKLLEYAMARSEKDPKGVKFTLPLDDKTIVKLLEYAIVNSLTDMIDKEKKKLK